MSLQRLSHPAGWLVLSLLVLSSAVSPSLSARPEADDLKLKILNLQKFSKPAEIRNKRNSKHFDETKTARKLSTSFLDLFGTKLTEDEVDVEKELDGNDKQLNRQAKVMKIRKKARFPRRSYGGYEAPVRSSRPATSYKAPSSKVSTHRPYIAKKSKDKPFTSFRSISSSKSSKPVSVTTPTYSAPEPPRQSYSVKSSSPSPPTATYSKPPTPSYTKPSPRYSKPPSTYSSPPSPTYSKPPSPSYSKPSTQTYSKPPSTYSKPPSPSYPKPPSPTYSKPPSPSYSKPQPSYSSSSPDSGSEYSYSYVVPETETQAWEERTGHSTTGSYSVLLPDGRTMTVSYSVPDTETGFVAEVSYQGEARYEEPAPRQQYNHKREAKLSSRGHKNSLTHFKSKSEQLEKELQLPKLDPPNKSLKFEEKDNVKDSNRRDNEEIKYPHFESFQYTGNLKGRIKNQRFEPVALYGEFPQLNSRSEEERRQKQSLHFLSPEKEARPPYFSQENYQTNFKTHIQREDRQQARASDLQTNVQPFVHFQTQHTRAKTVKEDKFG